MAMKTYHGSCHCGDVRFTAAFATWVAPGQRSPRLRLFACRRCSTGMYSSGDFGRGKFYAINVMALDDLDPGELAAAPIKYEDGLHDRWDRVPEDLRLL